MDQHYKQETLKEVSRMIERGMEQISPRELALRLENLGYEIKESDCFCYINKLNEISYNAKSIYIIHKKSRKCFSSVDSPKENIKELQEIRGNCFVFFRGKVWEL